jgi:hypothetical protein
MTLKQVKNRVLAIEKSDGDDERRHSLEDELYRELITAIANGQCTDPVACCKEAIKTLEMDFSRWKA